MILGLGTRIKEEWNSKEWTGSEDDWKGREIEIEEYGKARMTLFMGQISKLRMAIFAGWR